LKAAELLGKRFGLFTDKVNVESTAKVVIVDDLDE
jgi:phage terminase small subunit